MSGHVPPPGDARALFVASGRATTVAGHLIDAVALCAPINGVDVQVETPRSDSEIWAALRKRVDLLIFDGHGYLFPPRVGTVALDPARIRDGLGHGIAARVFVLGACGGASGSFRNAVRACIDTQTVFLGCTGRAPFADAELVFPRVVGLLAGSGMQLSAAGFRGQLSAMLGQIGAADRGWTASVLTPAAPGAR